MVFTTKLETLKAEYSKAEERMKMLEKEIKELEEKDEETKNKLNESVLTIKDFCAETQCKNCMFYTGKQSIYARCSLMNTNPTQWQIK